MEENWKTGNIQLREIEVKPNTWSPNLEWPIENLKFDELRIVQYNKSKQSFEVFDRWTHKLKMVMCFKSVLTLKTKSNITNSISFFRYRTFRFL